MRTIPNGRHKRLQAAALLSLITVWGCDTDQVVGPDHGSPTQMVLGLAGSNLSGETFEGTGTYEQTDGNCLDAPFIVTLTFQVTGTAAGPFPGTFSEAGRLIIRFPGPPTFTEQAVTLQQVQEGIVVGFDAEFHIASLAGEVDGLKSGIRGGGVASCDEASGLVTSIQFNSTSNYSATIITPAGTTQDNGLTTVEISGANGVLTLMESFVSEAGEPSLVLDPPAAINEVGTKHCITATVRDASGEPVAGVEVFFTVTGSVNTMGSRITDANGEAEFCYQGPALPGDDLITAFADFDGDRMQDADEPIGIANKSWVLPVTTPGCEIKITNGGWITAVNGDRATFGGNAKSSADGDTQGQEEYQDHGPAQPLNVHSINVLTIVCDGLGKEASIYGRATVNGAGSFFYRIKVRDMADPGVGMDTYWILVANLYTSGEQLLRGGNVQIHLQR